MHDSWKELLEMAEPGKPDVAEIVNRVKEYLASASNENLINLPVAEAMVTYKEKSSDEESSQVFIPFVSDVKVGSEFISTQNPTSIELDDTLGSPPPPEGMRVTPPSSPHVGSGHALEPNQAKERPDVEPIDLQLDYWTVEGSNPGSSAPGPGSAAGLASSVSSMTSSGKRMDHSSSRSDSRREFGRSSESGGGKASIKTSVWFMQVIKPFLPVTGSGEQPTFTMHYWLKEKKQKSKI